VKDVALHVSAIIASLQRVETQAKTMLQIARASGLSFGLDYTYLDDDIARLLGRLRYMRLIAMRWAAQFTEILHPRSAPLALSRLRHASVPPQGVSTWRTGARMRYTAAQRQGGRERSATAPRRQRDERADLFCAKE
jgi:hypothetical protein